MDKYDKIELIGFIMIIPYPLGLALLILYDILWGHQYTYYLPGVLFGVLVVIGYLLVLYAILQRHRERKK
jgi:hypothetical protein